MAMAVRDIYFDLWITQIKSNEFIGNEFCLSALCQMCQRHALVVTAERCGPQYHLVFKKQMMKYSGCVTFTYCLYVETCMQCLSWFLNGNVRCQLQR